MNNNYHHYISVECFVGLIVRIMYTLGALLKGALNLSLSSTSSYYLIDKIALAFIKID